MARASEHAPGSIAPVSGVYRQLNVFGTPTGTVVRVGRGEALPGAPIGFAWHLTEELPENEG